MAASATKSPPTKRAPPAAKASSADTGATAAAADTSATTPAGKPLPTKAVAAAAPKKAAAAPKKAAAVAPPAPAKKGGEAKARAPLAPPPQQQQREPAPLAEASVTMAQVVAQNKAQGIVSAQFPDLDLQSIPQGSAGVLLCKGGQYWMVFQFNRDDDEEMDAEGSPMTLQQIVPLQAFPLVHIPATEVEYKTCFSVSELLNPSVWRLLVWGDAKPGLDASRISTYWYTTYHILEHQFVKGARLRVYLKNVYCPFGIVPLTGDDGQPNGLYSVQVEPTPELMALFRLADRAMYMSGCTTLWRYKKTMQAAALKKPGMDYKDKYPTIGQIRDDLIKFNPVYKGKQFNEKLDKRLDKLFTFKVVQRDGAVAMKLYKGKEELPFDKFLEFCSDPIKSKEQREVIAKTGGSVKRVQFNADAVVELGTYCHSALGYGAQWRVTDLRPRPIAFTRAAVEMPEEDANDLALTTPASTLALAYKQEYPSGASDDGATSAADDSDGKYAGEYGSSSSAADIEHPPALEAGDEHTNGDEADHAPSQGDDPPATADTGDDAGETQQPLDEGADDSAPV